MPVACRSCGECPDKGVAGGAPGRLLAPPYFPSLTHFTEGKAAEQRSPQTTPPLKCTRRGDTTQDPWQPCEKSMDSELGGPGTGSTILHVPCASVSRTIMWRPRWESKACMETEGLRTHLPGAKVRVRAPEVSFLAAAALLHGIQRAHAPVLLEPHSI